MSDVEHRLTGADPAAALTYEHRDADAMVSRIIAQYPRRRTGLLRSFQLKVAGSATLAAALTVGGIAALNGAAPSFAVLAIGTAPHSGAAVPTNTKVGGMMAIFAQYHFSAGDSLSSTPATTPSYRLHFPRDGSAEAQRVAAVLGVNGVPVDVNGDGTDWAVTDGNGTSVNYETYGGVPQWYYSTNTPPTASTSSSDVAGGAVVSNQVLDADAHRYLQQFGYGFAVGDPQYSSSTVTTSDPTTTSNQATVSYGVFVGGVATDQSVTFTVDASNQLVDASGPAFSVAAGTDYPLISPTSGVDTLNAQQQRAFAQPNGDQSNSTTGTPTTVVAPSGTSATTPVTSAPGSLGSSGSNDTTTTIVTAPPIIDVTLNDTSVSLRSYAMTDGSVWMLPVYDYVGTFANADGTNETSTWSLMAVQPAYVDVSASTQPIAY